MGNKKKVIIDTVYDEEGGQHAYITIKKEPVTRFEESHYEKKGKSYSKKRKLGGQKGQWKRDLYAEELVLKAEISTEEKAQRTAELKKEKMDICGTDEKFEAIYGRA